MNDKQLNFITEYPQCRYNITTTCQEIKISRQLFYDWMEQDAEFKKEFENLEEFRIDLAEETLLQAMQVAMSVDAAKFLLNKKGRKRGYIEKTDIDITSNGQTLGATINIIKPEDKEESENG